jgi:NACalpha-BTF3-like transcription factor
MGKKSKYSSMVDEMREKVQKAGGSRFSKSDQTALTHTLMNTPEHEVPVYLKDCTDPVITKPTEHYRESLKPVLKQFGVDSAELDKIQTVEFPKDHAEAFNELAAVAMKDYMSTGRKIIFPVTSNEESQMEISMVNKEKKSEETRKLVETSPGKFESVPTGERKTTKAHTEIKAANKVPGWLVEKEKI